MKARSWLAASLAGAALLVTAPASAAALEFGSNLQSAPTGNNEQCLPSCTIWNGALHPVNTAGSLAAPISGVVTGFTLRKAAASVPAPWQPMHLRVVEPLGAPSWHGLAASSPDVTPTAAAGFESFNVRLPIGVGDYVGIEFNGNGIHYAFADAIFGAARLLENPALPEDGSPGSPVSTNRELLMRATVEPDADGDGFGDETQDKCASQKATQGTCPGSPSSSKKKCKKKKKKSKSRAAGSAAKKKKKKCRKRKRGKGK